MLGIPDLFNIAFAAIPWTRQVHLGIRRLAACTDHDVRSATAVLRAPPDSDSDSAPSRPSLGAISRKGTPCTSTIDSNNHETASSRASLSPAGKFRKRLKSEEFNRSPPAWLEGWMKHAVSASGLAFK